MLKRFLIYLIICLIIGGMNFYITNNVYFSIGLFIIGILIFSLGIDKSINQFFIKEKKTKEAINFISNFIITLSINKSILSTFNTVEESFSKDLKNQVYLINNLNVEEKIKYLSKYFALSIYDVFLNLIDQYIYNGGDVLKISQLLLFDVRKIEEKLDSHNDILIKKLMEFIILWIMIFVIVIIMKLSLADYFLKIASLDYFKYGMGIFYLGFYLNLLIFTLHGCNLDFIETSKIKNEEVTKKWKVKNVKVKRKDRVL